MYTNTDLEHLLTQRCARTCVYIHIYDLVSFYDSL